MGAGEITPRSSDISLNISKAQQRTLHALAQGARIELVRDDHGRIVERGTHRELLAAEGEYARMWALQQQAAQAEEVLERAKLA